MVRMLLTGSTIAYTALLLPFAGAAVRGYHARAAAFNGGLLGSRRAFGFQAGRGGYFCVSPSVLYVRASFETA
jgi:hypothetical protein